MEMNVEKTKVMRISRQPFPVKIMVDQKHLENVESFKYLGDILTNDCHIGALVERGPLTLRLLTSYIYGAPILDVSRSHTTQHSR